MVEPPKKSQFKERMEEPFDIEILTPEEKARRDAQKNQVKKTNELFKKKEDKDTKK